LAEEPELLPVLSAFVSVDEPELPLFAPLFPLSVVPLPHAVSIRLRTSAGTSNMLFFILTSLY
jgi:hypothetical protein